MAPPLLGNVLEKHVDYERHFRYVLKEARKWAKITSFDAKADTFRMGSGILSKTYSRLHYEQRVGLMLSTFKVADPGLMTTMRAKMLGMAPEEELKEIVGKLKEMQRKMWREAGGATVAAVFGLDARKREREGYEGCEDGVDVEGVEVVVAVTEEFMEQALGNVFGNMEYVFAGEEKDHEQYEETCDRIAKLLQNDESNRGSMDFVVERNDVDSATMAEIRVLATQIAGKPQPQITNTANQRGIPSASQPNTARGVQQSSSQPTAPNTARGANPNPPHGLVSAMSPRASNPTAGARPSVVPPLALRSVAGNGGAPGPSGVGATPGSSASASGSSSTRSLNNSNPLSARGSSKNFGLLSSFGSFAASAGSYEAPPPSARGPRGTVDAYPKTTSARPVATPRGGPVRPPLPGSPVMRGAPEGSSRPAEAPAGGQRRVGGIPIPKWNPPTL